MFSQLGPLFKVYQRRAETSNTRQNIPHEEHKDYIKDKKQNHKGKKTEEKWTDDTIVSVVALKSFLINFLKTLPEAQDSGFLKNYKDEAAVRPARPPQKIKPTNTHNAKAVRAYQTMATHSKSNSSDKKDDAQNKHIEKTTASNTLESKELRDIHQLITDLDYLQSKNITHLNIMKADSFINGMKEAVELEKSKI
jgi:hypothetical protein